MGTRWLSEELESYIEPPSPEEQQRAMEHAAAHAHDAVELKEFLEMLGILQDEEEAETGRFCLRGHPLTTADDSRGCRECRRMRQKPNCKHGHPLSGDNLKIEPDGHRRCRQCMRATSERHRVLRPCLRCGGEKQRGERHLCGKCKGV